MSKNESKEPPKNTPGRPGKLVKIPGTIEDAITRLVSPEKPKGKSGAKKGSKDK